MDIGAKSILNEDGSCAQQHMALVPGGDLEALLRAMILNRVMDRRFLALQRQGRLGFWMTSTGEEAVTIGAAYALEEGTASCADFHTALNFGGVLNAQTVFVIRNNGYAISTHSRQTN